MISLPDVNALVALFDPHHVHHTAIHGWFAENREEGWATCPLTENGLIRIVSNPKYPGRKTTVTDAVERLARFGRAGTTHSGGTRSRAAIRAGSPSATCSTIASSPMSTSSHWRSRIAAAW